MITPLDNLPDNMVGFCATGTVTENDFIDTVMPQVNALIARTGRLNYLLVLDTSIKNFTVGAWLKDAMMGLKHLAKWNRAAIVTDVEGIRTFTGIFGVLMPGEFKGFEHNHLPAAIDWVSEKTNPA